MSPLTFIEDQRRPDAAPEQPPEGGMSYSEFVRSRTNNAEMGMVRTIIDRILENEMRTIQTREAIYADMCNGRINFGNGFHNLLANERSGTCQRTGFLVGYATAIGMQTDMLRSVQAGFGGNLHHLPRANGVAAATGSNGGMNGNGVAGTRGSNGEMNGNGEASGEHGVDNTNGEEMTEMEDSNENGEINGNGDANGHDIVHGDARGLVNGEV